MRTNERIHWRTHQRMNQPTNTTDRNTSWRRQIVEKALVGRHICQACATPPAHNAARLPHSRPPPNYHCNRWPETNYKERTHKPTYQRTNQPANKHDRLQYLLANFWFQQFAIPKGSQTFNSQTRGPHVALKDIIINGPRRIS